MTDQPEKKPRKKSVRKKEGVVQRLDDVRLASTAKLVPKGFKPFALRNMETEQDVIDFLRTVADAGDVDAQYLVKVLETFTVNDLIVEGVVRIVKD